MKKRKEKKKENTRRRKESKTIDKKRKRDKEKEKTREKEILFPFPLPPVIFPSHSLLPPLAFPPLRSARSASLFRHLSCFLAHRSSSASPAPAPARSHAAGAAVAVAVVVVARRGVRPGGALDYACGPAGAADCAPIQASGLCYLPNTLAAHASYAFNSVFQRARAAPGACDFAGTATITLTDPSQ
uniref:X8 domain-containing protein n=1 Tax=Oryza brachyantha TaxID=4533 RepID=J3LD21_ORYBR